MGNKNLLFLARFGVYSHSSDICTYIFDFYAIWCKYDDIVKRGYMGLHDCRLYYMYRFCSVMFVCSILGVSRSACVVKSKLPRRMSSKASSSL